MEKLKSVTTWVGLVVILFGGYDLIINGANAQNIALVSIGVGLILAKDGNFKRA